jgi:hypothetical protein
MAEETKMLLVFLDTVNEGMKNLKEKCVETATAVELFADPSIPMDFVRGLNFELELSNAGKNALNWDESILDGIPSFSSKVCEFIDAHEDEIICLKD